jgi:hypothetical protein
VYVLTLAIAVFGAITGAASLGWSVASHVLSGGRVSVELLAGWVGPSNLITGPLTLKPLDPDLSFVDQPVLAVKARNTGRLPVSVEGWAVKFGDMSLGHVQHFANEPVPKLLGVGESATWVAPLDQVLAAIEATRSVGMDTKDLRGTVSLGSGKARRSKIAPVSGAELPKAFLPTR